MEGRKPCTRRQVSGFNVNPELFMAAVLVSSSCPDLQGQRIDQFHGVGQVDEVTGAYRVVYGVLTTNQRF